MKWKLECDSLYNSITKHLFPVTQDVALLFYTWVLCISFFQILFSHLFGLTVEIFILCDSWGKRNHNVVSCHITLRLSKGGPVVFFSPVLEDPNYFEWLLSWHWGILEEISGAVWLITTIILNPTGWVTERQDSCKRKCSYGITWI